MVRCGCVWPGAVRCGPVQSGAVISQTGRGGVGRVATLELLLILLTVFLCLVIISIISVFHSICNLLFTLHMKSCAANTEYMLPVHFAEFHFAEFHFAEFQLAEVQIGGSSVSLGHITLNLCRNDRRNGIRQNDTEYITNISLYPLHFCVIIKSLLKLIEIEHVN